MSDSSNKSDPPERRKSRETYEGTRFEDQRLQHIHTQLLREKEEPSENFSPMPLFFVALFMILAFWGGVYLVHYSGDFGPFYYDETAPVGAVADAGPKEVDMMALGKRVYSQNCVACHQGDGNGLPNVYPPVADSDWVQDNPERLVNIVLAGMAGNITVNGKDYNNAMTPFNRLSDQEIAAVLTYIRTSEDFQNDSYEVSESLVEEVRSEYGERTEQWTESELNEIYGEPDGQWEPEADPEEEADSEEEAGSDEEASDSEENSGPSEESSEEGDAGEDTEA